MFGYKKVNIKDIKISPKFKEHKPKKKKLKEKRLYYRVYNKFEQPIILNEEGYLIDGYTTYLLAKEFNEKQIKVKIQK